MSWGKYENSLRAKDDLKALKRSRRWARDKRRRPSMSDRVFALGSQRYRQVSLALHRAGLTSPFDYTYLPARSKWSKKAIELYDRHIAPWHNLHELEELLEMLLYELKQS